VRTTSKTVIFMHPFNLSGTDEVQAAGTYTVETDEEPIEPSSFPAYRRIATLLRLERNAGAFLTQIVETNPAELAAALARDAQPDETVPARARSDGVVPRKRAGGGTDSFRGGWRDWVAFNATDLTWMALVIGGVLFTTLLMRG
jgi:hypothetical protein